MCHNGVRRTFSDHNQTCLYTKQPQSALLVSSEGLDTESWMLAVKERPYLWYFYSDKYENWAEKNKMLQKVLQTGDIDFATPEEKLDLWK